MPTEIIDTSSKVTDYINTFLRPLSPYTYYKRDKRAECIVNESIKRGEYDYVACRYIGHAIKCGLIRLH